MPRLLLLLVAIACTPKPPVAVHDPVQSSETEPETETETAARAGDQGPDAASDTAPQADTDTTKPPPTEIVLALPPPPTDVIDPNRWRRTYNHAVQTHHAGDAAKALELARQALGMAHEPEDQHTALLMVAIAASDAGQRDIEFAALDRLDGTEVPWPVWWNGALDAVGHPARSARYAKAALAGTDQDAMVAPFAARAALRVQALDDALAAWRRLPDPDPLLGEDLAEALAEAGRCDDARTVLPDACP